MLGIRFSNFIALFLGLVLSSTASVAQNDGSYDNSYDFDGKAFISTSTASGAQTRIWLTSSGAGNTRPLLITTDAGAGGSFRITQFDTEGQTTQTQTQTWSGVTLSHLKAVGSHNGHELYLTASATTGTSSSAVVNNWVIKMRKNAGTGQYGLDDLFGTNGVASLRTTQGGFISDLRSGAIYWDGTDLFVTQAFNRFIQDHVKHFNVITKVRKSNGHIMAENSITGFGSQARILQLEKADDGQLLVSMLNDFSQKLSVIKVAFDGNGSVPQSIMTLVTLAGSNSNAHVTVGMNGELFVLRNRHKMVNVNSRDANQTPLPMPMETTVPGLSKLGASMQQPDGKLLVAATTGPMDLSGTPQLGAQFVHARLHTDHSLDTGFAVNGLQNVHEGTWTSAMSICLGLHAGQRRLVAFGHGVDDLGANMAVSTRLHTTQWDVVPDAIVWADKSAAPHQKVWSDWVVITGLSEGIQVPAVLVSTTYDAFAQLSVNTTYGTTAVSPYRVWVKNGDRLRVRLQAGDANGQVREAVVRVGDGLRNCSGTLQSTDVVAPTFTVTALAK